MNHVSARILFILQLVLFISGVGGMVFILHTLEDQAQYAQRMGLGA